MPAADSDAAGTGGRLRRSLSRADLTAMGVGTIVGAGIFVSTGVAAAAKAGPSFVFSFLIAGAARSLAGSGRSARRGCPWCRRSPLAGGTGRTPAGAAGAAAAPSRPATPAAGREAA